MRYEFNPYTLTYQEKNEPKFRRVFRVVLGVTVSLGVTALIVWLYLGVFEFALPKTLILQKRHTAWATRTEVMRRQLEFYNTTLRGIEERDNDVYRTIYGMDTLAVDTLVSGSTLSGLLTTLESRAVRRSYSLDSILKVSSEAGDMMSHIPAVPPILPQKGKFRISSYFGHRVDPVSHRSRAFHEGQDFAAGKGTPVYVTADGVVERVDYKFGGYGNEIVVDHGFGYKTRYAHLKSMVVTEGQKLRRGDFIAQIGNTGKSTGPHLHYEVMYKGKRVNPADYMDMDLTIEEYRAMVKQREEEDPHPFDKRLNTSDLLRKRR